MMNTTTTTNTSAVVTTSNPIFTVYCPNIEEYKIKLLKTQRAAQVLEAYKYFMINANISTISNYHVIRFPNTTGANNNRRTCMSIIKVNPFKNEWNDKKFRYCIIGKDTLSEIKQIFDHEKRKMLLNIPSFYTNKHYENPIYGFYLRVNGDKFPLPLFGTNSAEMLNLYFPEGNVLKIGNAVIEVLPIFDDDIVLEEVIASYASDSIERLNEKIIKKTILRAIEESFEDDEYI